METFAIISVVLGCIAVFFGLSLWIILEEARRLKASNEFFCELLKTRAEQVNNLEKRIEVLQKGNNRYKSKLHRRERRIKNLLTKTEKVGL